jgi:hypothetical protein
MLRLGMRVHTCALVLLATFGCRPPPHVDLSLAMDQCVASAGNPLPPKSCASLTLDCANFVEARLYQSDAQGTIGRLLGSSCVPTASLGAPPDLCALQMARPPFALFSALPDGETVRFRIRAMSVADPSTGCNVDLPGAAAPTLVFDGLSAPVRLDGNDHHVAIELGVCGSCGIAGVESCDATSLPPDCVTPGNRCPDGSRALFVPGGCCGVCDPT